MFISYFPYFESMNIPFLNRKADSWVEYLIIIAVVVVIALVLLGVFGVISAPEAASAAGGH